MFNVDVMMLLLCPLLKKRGHNVLHLSAQYLLTPVLESCQTWYNGCPERIDDPYWFSGYTVKGQGQIAGLCTNDIHLISFDPFAWKFPNKYKGCP